MTEGVQATPKQRSPWFYVFLGCGGVLLVMVLLVVGLGVGLFRFAQGTVAGLTDPEVQKQTTGALLGRVPDGYTAVFSLSVPLLIDAVAMAKPRAGEALEGARSLERAERFFMYSRMTQSDRTKGLKGFFEGEGDAKELGSTLNFQVSETLGRGTLSLEGRKLLFVTARGTFKANQSVRFGDRPEDAQAPPAPQAGESFPGLATLVFFDCPADGKVRTGIWMQKDPSPDTPGAQLDSTGTVADTAQVKAFLEPLTPCGR